MRNLNIGTLAYLLPCIFLAWLGSAMTHAQQSDVADLLQLNFQVGGDHFSESGPNDTVAPEILGLLERVPAVRKANTRRFDANGKADSVAAIGVRADLLRAALGAQRGEASLLVFAEVFLDIQTQGNIGLEQYPRLIAIANTYPKSWEAGIAKLLLAISISNYDPKAVQKMVARLDHEARLLRNEKSASFRAFSGAFGIDGQKIYGEYVFLRVRNTARSGDLRGAAELARQLLPEISDDDKKKEMTADAEVLRAGHNPWPVSDGDSEVKDWISTLQK